MKKPSFRLLKAKNKMYLKAWKRARKFYITKFKKDIEEIKIIFKVELKTRLDLQDQRNRRQLEQKNKEISTLKKQITRMRKQHEKYLELKKDLEDVKSHLSVTFDSLFLTIGKLKNSFDRIDYIDYKHKKIKEKL